MSDDEGYVHDPAAFDEQGEPVTKADGSAGEADGSAGDADGSVADPTREGTDSLATSNESGSATPTADETDQESLTGVHPTAVDREFGWRGWVLVGVIVLAFVVAPVAVYLYPPEASGYMFALIVFPLLPAILLGLAAVWATTRP